MALKLFAVITIFFFISPSLSLAQIVFPGMPAGQVIDIQGILSALLSLIWLVVITTVVVLFVLIGFKFLTSQGEAEKLAAARRLLIWSIMGTVVIIISFSIVGILITTFFPAQ